MTATIGRSTAISTRAQRSPGGLNHPMVVTSVPMGRIIQRVPFQNQPTLCRIDLVRDEGRPAPPPVFLKTTGPSPESKAADIPNSLLKERIGQNLNSGS